MDSSQVDWKLINDILDKKDCSFIETKKDHEDSSYKTRYYKTPIEGIILAERYYEDSYGGDDRRVDTKFVKAKEKVVLDYEEI